MAREPFLLLAVAALTGGMLWLARARPVDTTPPATTDDATTMVASPRGVEQAVGELAPQPIPPPAAGADRSRLLELPDGTFVDALNGATDPKPLAEFWGQQVPWSPIVGVEHNDHGVAWYRHENGSYSTTETLWDSAGKRHVTLTRVAHEGPASPAVAPRK